MKSNQYEGKCTFKMPIFHELCQATWVHLSDQTYYVNFFFKWSENCVRGRPESPLTPSWDSRRTWRLLRGERCVGKEVGRPCRRECLITLPTESLMLLHCNTLKHYTVADIQTSLLCSNTSLLAVYSDTSGCIWCAYTKYIAFVIPIPCRCIALRE